MIRGTTPTHVFKLPFDTGIIKTLRIIYAQDGKVKMTKTETDCTLDGENVTTKLSQEETLKFRSGTPVEIQMRVLSKGEDAMASKIVRVRVEEVLSDEVIE